MGKLRSTRRCPAISRTGVSSSPNDSVPVQIGRAMAGAVRGSVGLLGRRAAPVGGGVAIVRLTPLSALSLAAHHPDPVVDVLHPGDRIGDVLGAVLHPAPRHRTRQGHAPVLAAHLDVAGIHHRIITEALAQVFENAGIGTYISARAKSAVAVPAAARSAVGTLSG